MLQDIVQSFLHLPVDDHFPGPGQLFGEGGAEDPAATPVSLTEYSQTFSCREAPAARVRLSAWGTSSVTIPRNSYHALADYLGGKLRSSRLDRISTCAGGHWTIEYDRRRSPSTEQRCHESRSISSAAPPPEPSANSPSNCSRGCLFWRRPLRRAWRSRWRWRPVREDGHHVQVAPGEE